MSTGAIEQIYQSAASVQGQTGVDPAIIATIAATESGSQSNAGFFNLGIGTGAGAAGKGSSGSSVGGSGEAGQPSGFWAYTSGADAAQAFAAYIAKWQPGLVSSLGNAQAFFNPSGPILKSNYDVVYNVKGVPSSGLNMGAAAQYYANWQSYAAQLVSALTGSTPTSTSGGTTDQGGNGQVTVGGQTQAQPGSVSTTVQSNPQTTSTLGVDPNGSAAGSTGASSAGNFGATLQHLFITGGLILVALVLFVGGILLLSSGGGSKITLGELPGSHERGYRRGVTDTAAEFAEGAAA